MKKLIALLIIIAGIYGCEDIVSVPDISEENIIVLAPADGSVLNISDVTFSWEEIEFADRYQVQVAQPTFESANQIVLDTILGDSLQSFRSFTKSLAPDMYQWRVRGINSNFQTGYTTQSFTVENTTANLSDQTVVITAPEDNFETSETMVLLSWEAIDEATLYRVVIIDLSDNSTFLEQTTTETEISVNFTSGMYSWAVRAENDLQNTSFTEQTITIL